MSKTGGIIYNRKLAGQLNDFSNFKLPRNITPTDRDLFCEISGLFFFGEGKMEGKEIDKHDGQTKAFTREVDAIGNNAVLFIYKYNTPSNQDIDVANCIVTEIYYHGTWYKPRTIATLNNAILLWLKFKL